MKIGVVTMRRHLDNVGEEVVEAFRAFLLREVAFDLITQNNPDIRYPYSCV